MILPMAPPALPSLPRWLLALVLVAAVCASAAPAWSDRPGFVLQGSDVRDDNDQVTIDARFEPLLSPEARDALDSGVPLTLQLQVRVIEPGGRWWWWDAEVTERNLDIELRYHALSRRYVVINHATDERRTFFRRDVALTAWASATGMPVVHRSQLDSGTRYELQLRARLNVDALPHPLRTVAYVSPEWRLASEWYTWRLDG